MAKLKLVLVAVAAVFLIWMLNEVGWDAISHHLKLVGWGWPIILLPYLCFNLLNSISWRLTIETPPSSLTIRHLFFIRLAGEAINALTPAASLGGEPLKALLLQKSGVSLTNATASVLISKGIMVLGLVAYALMGIIMSFSLLLLPKGWVIGLTFAAIALGLAGVIFILGQNQGLCRIGINVLQKFKLLPRRLQEQKEALYRLDAHIASYYQHHRREFYMAIGCLFLGWLFHGLEVYIIFYLLDHPLSLTTALCFDALATLVASAAFFIPGNLGVQDGGNVLLAIGLQLGAVLGATFAVIRRLREGFWLAVGLIFYTLQD
jgi:glycosyltransferase 2 family protein